MEINFIRMISFVGLAYILFGIAFWMRNKEFEDWVIRKYLHMVGLLTAGVVGAFYNNLLELLFGVIILVISVILLSLRSNGFMQQVVKMASRKEETKFIAIINGVLTNLTLVTLVIIFFDQKWVFLAAISCVAIGDGSAEFVGRKFGKMKYKIFSEKSIEGSLAVLMGSILGGVISLTLFNQLTPFALLIIIIASCVVTIIEALSVYFIDNVFMQISYAFLLWFFLI